MTDQLIRQYLGFDENDLNANRSGALSEKQRRKLLNERKTSKVGGILGGLFFLGISSIFPLTFGPLAVTLFQEGEIGSGIGSLAAALIWLVVWGGIGLVIFASVFRQAAPKVVLKHVTGPINLAGVERRTGGEHSHTYIQHELYIVGKEFDVSEAVCGCLMQGDVYTIYWVENLNGSGAEILSLEKQAAA
jgi:hypothetical protein